MSSREWSSREFHEDLVLGMDVAIGVAHEADRSQRFVELLPVHGALNHEIDVDRLMHCAGTAGEHGLQAVASECIADS